MRKTCILGMVCFLSLISCTQERRPYLVLLDHTIENKAQYDSAHERLENTYRYQYRMAQSDSARWEAAYRLEKIFFYHDVDSCYSNVRKMLRLHGGDAHRHGVSSACYANILYKMDSLDRALAVFETIDTSSLGTDGFRTYGYAGYHIYRKLLHDSPQYDQACQKVIDDWWKRDSTHIECTYYHIDRLRKEGIRIHGLEKLQSCVLTSPNDTAKSYYFQAMEHLNTGDLDKATECFATSATYDLRVSAKAYNALYELARILFRRGDIQRADRYMRITLADANSSHYALRYNDIISSEFEIMNVVLKQEQNRKIAYIVGIVAVSFMLLVAIALVLLLGHYSTELNVSGQQLNEVSKIKDGFLANYMEKCVDYLNKVDEYRSTLRHTAKQEGPKAIMAMLRKPSFAEGEFNELLSSMDSTFLGIFPDFVDKVNEHMLPDYRLEMPDNGKLSTELRILALIKMGISKRQKIAKILNMSVTTVYSYHSLLQKHSLHPDDSFDKVIAGL